MRRTESAAEVWARPRRFEMGRVGAPRATSPATGLTCRPWRAPGSPVGLLATKTLALARLLLLAGRYMSKIMQFVDTLWRRVDHFDMSAWLVEFLGNFQHELPAEQAIQ